MRNVCATDIERPGNILGIGNEQRIRAQFLQLCADTFELVGRWFAGKFDLPQGHCANGWFRPVTPDRVDGVVVDRHQFGACCGAGLPHLFTCSLVWSQGS